MSNFANLCTFQLIEHVRGPRECARVLAATGPEKCLALQFHRRGRAWVEAGVSSELSLADHKRLLRTVDAPRLVSRIDLFLPGPEPRSPDDFHAAPLRFRQRQSGASAASEVEYALVADALVHRVSSLRARRRDGARSASGGIRGAIEEIVVENPDGPTVRGWQDVAAKCRPFIQRRGADLFLSDRAELLLFAFRQRGDLDLSLNLADVSKEERDLFVMSEASLHQNHHEMERLDEALRFCAATEPTGGPSVGSDLDSRAAESMWAMDWAQRRGATTRAGLDRLRSQALDFIASWGH